MTYYWYCQECDIFYTTDDLKSFGSAEDECPKCDNLLINQVRLNISTKLEFKIIKEECKNGAFKLSEWTTNWRIERNPFLQSGKRLK